MIRFLALLSGALLVGAITVLSPLAGLPAVVLVIAGRWLRSCAVAAVLLAVGVLASVDTGVLAAAATGLVATTYLLHIATMAAPYGVVATTIPSVVGALMFTAAAAGAAALPLHVPWAPLAAPIVVILLFAILVRILVPRRRSAPDS